MLGWLKKVATSFGLIQEVPPSELPDRFKAISAEIEAEARAKEQTGQSPYGGELDAPEREVGAVLRKVVALVAITMACFGGWWVMRSLTLLPTEQRAVSEALIWAIWTTAVVSIATGRRLR